MTYIKYQDKFYKQIDLKDLWKKELIELITKAIEVKENRVVEYINSNRHHYWKTQPMRLNNQLNMATKNCDIVNWLSELDKPNLLSMAQNI